MGFEQLVALKAQQNQDAKGKKAASRRTSTPVGVEREIKQPSKRPGTSADAATRAVTTLQRHFPHAFPCSPAPKVPLKVGILKDVLVQAASLALSERDARNGVKLWCRGQRYWTCLVEGNMRVDLTGAITGVVSAAEAEYGASQEKARLARRQSKLRTIDMVGRVDRQEDRLNRGRLDFRVETGLWPIKSDKALPSGTKLMYRKINNLLSGRQTRSLLEALAGGGGDDSYARR